MRLVVDLQLVEPESASVLRSDRQAAHVAGVGVRVTLHDQDLRPDVQLLHPLHEGDEGEGALIPDDALGISEDADAGGVVNDRRLAGLDLDQRLDGHGAS